MPNKKVSHISIGNNSYDVKHYNIVTSSNFPANPDADAVPNVASVKAYVDSQKEVGLSIVVLSSLPVASEESYLTYQHNVVLVPNGSGSASNSHSEYLILHDETEGADPEYYWEKIGDTATSVIGIKSNGTLSDYVTGASANSVSTVDSAAVQFEAASATLSRDNYTPAGSVDTQITAPKVAVAKVVSEGTGYSLTPGSATLGQSTSGSFVTGISDLAVTSTGGNVYSVSYDEDTSTISFAELTLGITGNISTGNAITGVGALQYTAPTLSGALPTFDVENVVSGVSATSTFTGTEEAGLKVTSASYQKAKDAISLTKTDKAINVSLTKGSKNVEVVSYE